jgi:hypothetical protein
MQVRLYATRHTETLLASTLQVGPGRLSGKMQLTMNLLTYKEARTIGAEIFTYHCCQFCGGLVTEHVHTADDFDECERESPPVCAECRGAAKDRPEARSPELGPVVGSNLRRIRNGARALVQTHGSRSGVSRAMLGEIELRQSTPTINTL